MSWQETLHACWMMYPKDMVVIISLAILCGIGLAICVFAILLARGD